MLKPVVWSKGDRGGDGNENAFKLFQSRFCMLWKLHLCRDCLLLARLGARGESALQC